MLVARRFAGMLAAVERATTEIRALKRSSPFLDHGGAIHCDVRLTAVLLFCPVAAEDVLLFLAAVASRWDSDLAGSTGALVAWP